jgi:phosphotransacetylase
MDVPTYHKVLIVADGAINIAQPEDKVISVRTQLIWLFHSVRNQRSPFSAQSKQSPRRCPPPSMGRAARWLKEDRSGALLDGPLAFDNAISKQAPDEGIS